MMITYFILLWCSSSLISSDKILVVPIPMYSQFNQGLEAARALASVGHEVWMLSSERFEKKISKHNINYLLYEKGLSSSEDSIAETLENDLRDHNEIRFNMLRFVSILTEADKVICQDFFQNRDLLDKIKDLNFDLSVMFTIPTMQCFFLINQMFNIPYVTILPTDFMWLFNVPILPTSSPLPFSLFNDDMNLFYRTMNLIGHILLPKLISSGNDFEVHFDDFTLQRDFIFKNTSLHFVNLNVHCLDYPRLSSPNYIFVPGLSSITDEILSGSIAQLMENSQHGVIFIAFGSIKLSRIALKSILPTLIEVLKNLKEDIILAYDNIENLDFPNNFHALDWAPQNGILAHKNCKIFITHAGGNSQMEAVHHGVPMLAIPFSPEQEYNGERARIHGFGEYIAINTLTKDNLKLTIEEMLTDDSYKSAIRKCSKITQSLPSGKATFVFWIDHILQFGSSHLRPKSFDLPFYSVIMLDSLVVIITVFIIFCIIVLALFKLIWILIKKLCKCKKKTD